MYKIARAVAPNEIELWRLAVELQQRRIVVDCESLDDLLGANEATVDVRLYAVALRNLLRAVSLAIDAFPECSSSLRQAEEHFNEQVPHTRDVRDVLEHFDEYAMGTGKLIKGDGRGYPPAEGWQFGRDGTVVGFTIWRDDDQAPNIVVERELQLDTALATRAALRLAEDALRLIRR